jgi:hypothetical protein
MDPNLRRVNGIITADDRPYTALRWYLALVGQKYGYTILMVVIHSL